MLSIESRRSGYISARRTSRAILVAEARLAKVKKKERIKEEEKEKKQKKKERRD